MSSSDVKRTEQSVSGKAHLGTFCSVSTPTSMPVVRGTPEVSGQSDGPCQRYICQCEAVADAWADMFLPLSLVPASLQRLCGQESGHTSSKNLLFAAAVCTGNILAFLLATAYLRGLR